ncbi:precorrin-6y C5,15-methyltransferase (decarboxylating) subunit CbiE [Synechococcus sp. A10-1-5-1]|uniref:precorrin-6y C5,15-methyltransferase (decarboxylating) subunit CbiE n=1 Tax=Synechococcus sp. A10-1-5-1 TaxID=2936507 RepID=UPI002001797E|nr:precorrin-6y C5,15-methyltransferase (decarboxylating) subunit CbiE [Synechococcus sp. A10-1-5-1]UPM49916.1 precorrin-6y C5,15-methyltransferase (decarboxylating) subunit CbiE [Synechococcus sp. A10-1-5-1]
MIEVIGTDAGAPASLPLDKQQLLRQATLVAAPHRLYESLQRWEGWSGAPLIASDQPAALIDQLQGQQQAVVLASGDPLWFGIGRLLIQGLGAERLRFHPSPCSLQLAFSRLARPWQNASWISLHGRDPAALAARLQQRPEALAVLTDPSRGGVAEVRELLRASGLEQAYGLWLCERLGHPEERVQRLAPAAELPRDLDPLHLVVLLAEPPEQPDPEQLPLIGIADGLYLQHPDRPGLMTKREVRIQLLADLDLPAAGVLWDLGAGVGSVGLEALRLRPALQLWALEQRGGSAALIASNAERLGVRPAAVVEGRAPEALADLPDPDRVLIGGGGRERAAVLAAVLERLRPGGVVVIPLATIEALAELRPVLEQAGLQVSISQHQAWRGAPLADGTRLAPLNPVLVLRGKKVAA